MALDDLKGVIEKLQGMIGSHPDYLSRIETRTRQVLIDPLLYALGWDVSDPKTVQLEYKPGKEPADYALMLKNHPVAIIEAKPLGGDLAEKGTKQALNYANSEGIPYMIVTDGDKWEMYEVFKQAALEERQLMKFQLSQQPSHEIALQALRIWKPSLASGSPKEAMKPVLEFPPDKIEEVAVPPAPVPGPAVGLKPDETWIGKKISGFTFDGKPYKVKKWNEFLVKFCKILSKDDALQFRDVLELEPSRFSENRDSFPPSTNSASIKEIGKTGIYVHTGINNDHKREVIEAIVEHFGLRMPVPHTDEGG